MAAKTGMLERVREVLRERGPLSIDDIADALGEDRKVVGPRVRVAASPSNHALLRLADGRYALPKGAKGGPPPRRADASKALAAPVARAPLPVVASPEAFPPSPAVQLEDDFVRRLLAMRADVITAARSRVAKLDELIASCGAPTP